MTGFSLQWQGLDKLVRQAHALGQPPTVQELQEDLLFAVEPVVDQARRIAPRSPGSPTHGDQHAADTITAAPEEVKDQAGVAAVAVGPTAKGWWLVFFEEGTFKLAARPWLRPAIDQSVGAFARRFAERQQARLRRAA